MKDLRYVFKIMISLFVAIFLNACSALYDSPDTSKDENLSQISVSGVKYGQVSGEFAINGEKTASKDENFIANSHIAKTVMPDVSGNDIATYSIIASAQGFDNVEVSKPFSSTYSLSLLYNPGGTEWTIKATGKNAGGTDITFCTKKITLSAETPNVSANINLTYSQDSDNGKGTFNITVNFPTDKEIKKVQYIITKFGETYSASDVKTVDAPDTGTISITSDGFESGTLDGIPDEMEPGPYNGIIKFLSGSDDSGYTEVYAVNQIINIYSNLVTTKAVGTAPYIGSNGSFEIPSSFVGATTFFVGGNGIGEDHKAASDTNNGTPFDPFATLGHAIAIIKASDASPAGGFVINMMGNTVETDVVYITKKITIQKYGGATSDKPTIDFNGKGSLNVSENLALKNIKIANGKNTYGGGGIYVSAVGSLVAEGILISGCNGTSTTYGGGAILALGSVEINNSKIENCNTACVSAVSTTYGGGAICYTGINSLKLSNVTFSGNSAPTSNGKDIYFNGSAEFENLTGDNAADDNTVSIYWDYHAYSASMKLSGNINAMPLCLMDSSQKIDCAALGKGSGPIRVSNPNALTWTFTNGFTGTPVSDYFVGINCTIETESAVSNEAAFVSDTTANSVYVSSSGSDYTGNGTKSKPYATFKKAALSFDNKTAVTAGGIPENTVYFLDDMTITEGMGFTDKCAVNLIGCKSGTPNASVKITSDLAAGSALQVQPDRIL